MFVGPSVFYAHRIMYQLWSREYKPMLAPHFQELEQFHPFERDNVLGKIIHVLVRGIGCTVLL